MIPIKQLANRLSQVLNSSKSTDDYVLLLERKDVYPTLLELNTLALTLPKKEKEEVFILISALSEIALDVNEEKKTFTPQNVTGDKNSVLGKLRKKE